MNNKVMAIVLILCVSIMPGCEAQKAADPPQGNAEPSAATITSGEVIQPDSENSEAEAVAVSVDEDEDEDVETIEEDHRVELIIGANRVAEATDFVFAPELSGIWEFRTSGSGDSDPYLAIFDCDGNEIGFDDDGAGGNDSLIVIYIDAPVTIELRFWNGGLGSTTLYADYATTDPSLAKLTAVEARIIAQTWLDGHPIQDPNIIEPFFYEMTVDGEEYFRFYIDSYQMYWFSILVQKETGALLYMMSPDGEDPVDEFELLEDWYAANYG